MILFYVFIAGFIGDENVYGNGVTNNKAGKFKRLLLFSGNDYLGLSSHPTIGKAAAKVFSLLLIIIVI